MAQDKVWVISGDYAITVTRGHECDPHISTPIIKEYLVVKETLRFVYVKECGRILRIETAKVYKSTDSAKNALLAIKTEFLSTKIIPMMNKLHEFVSNEHKVYVMQVKPDEIQI